MRSMRKLLVKPDCDVTQSHDYGSKLRDTVKMAATLSKMANFKSILQGHLFSKSHFFTKTRNNNGFLII